ncbi:MAG TPA: hypothetical protein VMZ50_13670, partial [Phycisphaerae bacterium]|nr:hypothetical protein [Phycisphaerae bacterium]
MRVVDGGPVGQARQDRQQAPPEEPARRIGVVEDHAEQLRNSAAFQLPRHQPNDLSPPRMMEIWSQGLDRILRTENGPGCEVFLERQVREAETVGTLLDQEPRPLLKSPQQRVCLRARLVGIEAQLVSHKRSDLA